MKYREIYEHERTCGAITELCTKCNDRFPRNGLLSSNCFSFLIELNRHLMNCDGTKQKRHFTGRHRDDSILCEKCSAPFPNFEDLQVHILTEHIQDI